MLGSVLVGLRVRIQQTQKDQTDEYIKRAVSCLGKDSSVGDHPDSKSLLTKQQELDQIFAQAVAALEGEEIPQESFRTFNEVYKDVREALERQV